MNRSITIRIDHFSYVKIILSAFLEVLNKKNRMLFPKMPSILDDSIFEYSPDKDPQTILLEEYFG